MARHRRPTLIAFALGVQALSMICLSQAQNSKSAPTSKPQRWVKTAKDTDSQMKENSDGREDFNFLIGKWKVHNRRLVKRLQNCTDWQEFPATLEVHSILGGLGNADKFSADYPDGKPLEGTTVRIFNPKAQVWSLYWVDNRTCQLQTPIVGCFAGNRGEFFANETFDDKPIRVRFVWVKTSAVTAHWEQAFSTDAGQTWETNWNMEFVRQE